MNQSREIKIVDWTPDLVIDIQRWRILRDLEIKVALNPPFKSRIIPSHSLTHKLEKASQAELAQQIKIYQELIKTGAFSNALMFYRLQLHEVLFFRYAEFKIILQLLKLFFKNKDEIIDIQDETIKSFLYLTAARCQVHCGNLMLAYQLFTRHNQIRQKAHDYEGTALGLLELANLIQIPQHDFQQASKGLTYVDKIIRKQKRVGFLAEVNFVRSQLAIGLGDFSQAQTLLQHSETVARGRLMHEKLSQIYALKAILNAAEKNHFLALGWAIKSLDEALESNQNLEIIRGLSLKAKMAINVLMNSELLNDDEKSDLIHETELCLMQCLESTNQHEIAFYQIDCLLEILKLRQWQYAATSDEWQQFKTEFLPLTNLIRELAMKSGWHSKLVELHTRQAHFYEVEGNKELAQQHFSLATTLRKS
jgi:hypothetical protein